MSRQVRSALVVARLCVVAVAVAFGLARGLGSHAAQAGGDTIASYAPVRANLAARSVQLPLVLWREGGVVPVPRAGFWSGEGCASPGGPCNQILLTVAADRRTLRMTIQAGRDNMNCPCGAIASGSFSCGGASRDYCTLTGTFTSEVDVRGHYVVNWYDVFHEEADWTGAWTRP